MAFSRRRLLKNILGSAAASQLGLVSNFVGSATGLVPSEGWRNRILIDPANVLGSLAFHKLDVGPYVDWFTGRWPMISFIGGMATGNVSQDLEFFYTEPFKWHTTILVYVLEDGGNIYGLRARFVPPEQRQLRVRQCPFRSYLLHIRADTLLEQYHPSYIYANGRRVWDYKKHKMGITMLSEKRGSGLRLGIDVPFSLEEPVDPLIDIVIDKEYTPDTKGLAFRTFFVHYLGEPGEKVDLVGADQEATGSPAERLKRFVFGLYPSGYYYWTSKGADIREIKKNWRPNFRPHYPTDDVYLSPFVDHPPAKGKYHDFMVTYGGCNIAGMGAPAELFKSNPYLRGALSDIKDPSDARRVFAIDPKLIVQWFRGENGTGATELETVEAAKKATGSPKRVMALYEPFPPSLARYVEYEHGTDLMILKNEEDPQYNILMSMGRGMGRTFSKPFGFYWEQTHYPFPSVDEKLQTCLLYYMSGSSWIGAEAEDAPSFAKDVVADWVFPYVQALRFAMVHPARGSNIVPVGIAYSEGDVWMIPYNPFGQMDTFLRYVGYDNATNKLTCEPNFTKIFPWMPQHDPLHEGWKYVGQLGTLYPRLDEMRGYDLLDVFFPNYGSAFTAHIVRLLTGTPYGPLDFVLLERASAEHLKTFGVLACLGHARVRTEIEAKLIAAARSGCQVMLGAQHLLADDSSITGKSFGLSFDRGSANIEGNVAGIPAIYGKQSGKFSGELFSASGEGWEIVASASRKPVVLRKKFGKGAVYMYLGRWIHFGGEVLRPVLAYIGAQAAPVRFHEPDDRIEYVAYKKNKGAWVALFNHGDIVIGCDRLNPKTWRVLPPEPLFSKVRGPYVGAVEFRLEKLNLNPEDDYALYEVAGIDGKDFDDVIAGHRTFDLKSIPYDFNGYTIKAILKFNKRAEYVIAPKGSAEKVFFGKP